jgi:hypothetical protein
VPSRKFLLLQLSSDTEYEIAPPAASKCGSNQGLMMYHPKAGPVRDCEKNLTCKGFDTEIIPSCAKYQLTCSMELAPSAPLNLVNSGSQYLGGRKIKS